MAEQERPEWINAHEEKPQRWGLYFVKVNGQKQMARQQEFDRLCEFNESVFWLAEPGERYKPPPAPEGFHFRRDEDPPTTPIEACEEQKYVALIEELSRPQPKVTQADIDEFQEWAKSATQGKIAAERKASKHGEGLTRAYLKTLERTKSERAVYSLVLVRKAFPEIQGKNDIPAHLLEQMTALYGEKGIDIIRGKLKNVYKSRESMSRNKHPKYTKKAS